MWWTVLIVAGILEQAPVDLWSDGYCHQVTVDVTPIDSGYIYAFVDSTWQKFEIRGLPRKFINWSIERRRETIQIIKEGGRPDLAGPHNAIVATYGVRRKDTRFRINNAVKGVGFVPKPDKLDDILQLLRNTMDADNARKLDILDSLYVNAYEIFDTTRLVSLELYSTPEFETHTFINEMLNPACAIVFLDIPSFELKAIAHLLHPDDPQLTPYERKVVEYTNLVHSYFHGRFEKNFITVIYYVIEVYDNTPGRGGRGVRLIP